MIKEVLSLNKIELPDSVLMRFKYITVDKWGVLLGHNARPHACNDYEQWEGIHKPDRLTLQNLNLHNYKWQKLIIKAKDLMTAVNREAVQRAKDTQVGGNHYKQFKIQPVEFIEANQLGYSVGNVIKYVCRYKDKNGIQDLEKAKHYIEMLIDREREDD